jgi:hypothetical protein
VVVTQSVPIRVEQKAGKRAREARGGHATRLACVFPAAGHPVPLISVPLLHVACGWAIGAGWGWVRGECRAVLCEKGRVVLLLLLLGTA